MKTKKWEGESFESSSGLTPQFAEFAKDWKADLKSITGPDFEIVNFNRGHFYLSGFLKHASGKLVYFSISDVRHFGADTWKDDILIRTAKHDRDYTGGSNNHTIFKDIKKNALQLIHERPGQVVEVKAPEAKKTITAKTARAFIVAHVINADVSYRGGSLKVDVSELFNTGDEPAIMGAYQNYLGGGMAGSIQTGRQFDISGFSKKDLKTYETMSEACKRYFYDLNNGRGDEYMQDEVTGPGAGGYDRLQKLPASGY